MPIGNFPLIEIIGTHRKIQSLAFGSGLCFDITFWPELCLKFTKGF